MLHPGKIQFTVENSHVASNTGDLVRARSVLEHRALPVKVWLLLLFGLSVLRSTGALACASFVSPVVFGNGFSCRWRSWAGACGRVRFRPRSRRVQSSPRRLPILEPEFSQPICSGSARHESSRVVLPLGAWSSHRINTDGMIDRVLSREKRLRRKKRLLLSRQFIF